MNFDLLIKNFIQVADKMNDEATKSLIRYLGEKVGEHEYLLPVIGQFSAGKSKLINHILGMDVLPSKNVETTAFPTFIKFGFREKAVVEHVDGEMEELELTDVKKLDYQSTKNLENPIKSLTVYVHNELLSQGLVFVDTPGVNTIVEEHTQITEQILSNSLFVLYVFAGALNAQDLLMIDKIQQLHIQCVFVHTKADWIKECEEDYKKTFRDEEMMLQERLQQHVHYFAITNSTEPEYIKLYEPNFQALMNFLKKEMGAQIDTVYKEAVLHKLSLIGEKYKVQTQEKRKLVALANSSTEEELSEKCQQINKAKEKIKKSIDKNYQNILNDEQQVINEIANQLSDYELVLGKQFKTKVNHTTYTDNENATRDFQQSLFENFERMAEKARARIIEYGNKSSEALNSDFKLIAEDLTRESGIPISIDLNLNVVSEFDHEQQLILDNFNEKMNRLKCLEEKSDQELGELGIQRTQLESVLAKFNETIEKSQDEVNLMEANYTPRYKTRESRLGPFMKKVGTVCDLATLLIPAKGWAKAAGWVGKGAGQLAKGGKIAQMGSKALNQVHNGLKVMEATDTVTDISKIVNGATRILDNDSELGAQRIVRDKKDPKKVHVLDYISLSYWFEKAGQLIDPSTTTIDLEYEQEYKQKCTEMRIQTQLKVNQSMSSYEKMNLCKTQEERMKKQKELYAKTESQHKKLLDQQLQILNEKKSVKIQDCIKEQMIKEFNCNLSSFRKLLQNRCVKEIESMREKIMSTASCVGLENLSSVEEQLSELNSQKQENQQALSAQLAELDELDKLLQVNE